MLGDAIYGVSTGRIKCQLIKDLYHYFPFITEITIFIYNIERII